MHGKSLPQRSSLASSSGRQQSCRAQPRREHQEPPEFTNQTHHHSHSHWGNWLSVALCTFLYMLQCPQSTVLVLDLVQIWSRPLQFISYFLIQWKYFLDLLIKKENVYKLWWWQWWLPLCSKAKIQIQIYLVSWTMLLNIRWLVSRIIVSNIFVFAYYWWENLSFQLPFI